MTLKNNFCSSPWFHMMILNSGEFSYCRWNAQPAQGNIKDQHPLTFFQTGLSEIRSTMLAGEPWDGCKSCLSAEQQGKVSGREKQLLKTGIITDEFAKSFRSSTFYHEFEKSSNTNGHTELAPVDWQIDLGSYCNSGCVFCLPESSTKLASEFKKLKIINELPPRAWCDDPVLLNKFFDTLTAIPNLTYLHFLGGETIITPAFQVILTKLIEAGLNRNIRIGFTTNLTQPSTEVVELLKQFNTVFIGMSIECLHPVNDYVRWPSQIDTVKSVVHQWIDLAHSQNWRLVLRPTPTVLTVSKLVSLYEFAWQQNIPVESVNFLHRPAHMRMNVLPMTERHRIADQLEHWVSQHQASSTVKIINYKDPGQTANEILQDASSYVNYLRTAPDETERFPDLIQYLKLLESSRSNCILDYLPEYENLFRSAGY